MTRKRFAQFVRKYGTPIAILVGTISIAGSIYISFGILNQKQTPPLSNSSVTGQQSTVPVSPDDDNFLGRSNAPVIMIEFGDFQCPFCRKFWKDVLPRLKVTYIDTGKLKFVYRDFPISSRHSAAEGAAEASGCAGEQGKFWEMHDKIYAEQDRQGEGTIPFGISELKRWAGELGLKTVQFNSCLDSGKFREEVQKDLLDGTNAGVTGTPNFFVNGKIIRGTGSYEMFARVIEEELAQ